MPPHRIEGPQGSANAEPLWVDNHCHLDMIDVADGAISQARVAGVAAMVAVGTDLASSVVALGIARSNPCVYSTAGLHPHDASVGTGGLADFVSGSLAEGEPLVAIGECGLDYHYDNSPRDAQRSVFAEQVRLAHHHGLPLVVHTRDAWDDTFAILDSEGVPSRTVVHCFTGGPAEAERCLERGTLLSISGIVTFRSAEDVRAAVRMTPLDRIMVETDSPFLAPVPFRGRPNSPAMVTVVGAAVAEVVDVPVDEVAAVTTATAARFYGLDLSGCTGPT